MFSHAFDPSVRFTPKGFSFNSTCISRLLRVVPLGDAMELWRTEQVEVLLNPVERMLAVRSCDADYPNAIRWADARGKSRWISAKAFCTILYEILGWDESFSYRAPATVRTRDGETIIFFDLDNYVGVPLRQKDAEKTVDEAESEAPKETVRHEDTRGIFYGAEDDEPQEVTDTEDMERRLREIAEYEKRHFGAPAFEHAAGLRRDCRDDRGIL